MNSSLNVALATRPYPGLRPFYRQEADIFFGRDEQVNELLERLAHSRLLAVVGTSGCSKSSLVRAGLITALETGLVVEAGARWRVASMRPGNQPLKNLAGALLTCLPAGAEGCKAADAAAFLQATLRRGPLGVVEVLRDTPLGEGENLLLLVDQFEEIFRFRKQEASDEADAFVALLLATARQLEFPVYVVLTMRSDFLGECALFTGLPEALNDSQFLTPRLTREQCQEAIEGPARVFGGRVEPALVTRLLNDMGADPDQLPLMQQTLLLLWLKATESVRGNRPGPSPDGTGPDGTGFVLKLADYEAMGGLREALSRHADEALTRLTDRQQAIAQTLFRCLSERGRGERATRRPARLETVAAVAGVSWEEAAAVADFFRDPDLNFLTPLPPTPLEPEVVLDLSHESLIDHWRSLRDWAEQEACSAETYCRLEQTARLWANGRAALWGTPDLENALTWRKEQQPSPVWAQRYGGDFDLALRFLEASEQQRKKGEAAAEAARRRKLKQAWRWLELVGAALVVSSGLTIWAE